MRVKDINKTEAIYKATMELLNEIGFADLSMSKIAKRAGVSVATIYIHFENKDDLLRKLYINTKKRLADAVFGILDDNMSLRDKIEKMLRSMISFILDNLSEYLFLEQMNNSPLIQNLNIEDEVPSYGVLYTLLESGKRDRVFKDVDVHLLLAFCNMPVTYLVKEHIRGTHTMSEKDIQDGINMAWDAIIK
jgi:AcrR family transcriptional regulator